jgi:prophage regulatory protein
MEMEETMTKSNPTQRRDDIARAQQPDVFLTFDDLRTLGIGYSRVHLRRLMAAGQFPAAVQLSPNRIAWRQRDVIDWQQSRPMAGAARAKS